MELLKTEQRIITSVKLYVFDPENNVLLLQKPDDDPFDPSGYDIVGGEVLPDELPSEALKRETFEEIQLDFAAKYVRKVRPLWEGKPKIDSSRRYNHLHHRLFYRALLDIQFDPILNSESQKSIWLPIMDAHAKLTHPIKQRGLLRAAEESGILVY